MTGSIVFTHYEFLKNLGKENNDRARILYIRTINADIMKALSKVVIVYRIIMYQHFLMIKGRSTAIDM